MLHALDEMLSMEFISLELVCLSFLKTTSNSVIPYLCFKLMFLFKFSWKRRNPSFQTILRLLTHSVISARSKKQLFFILDILDHMHIDSTVTS